LVHPKGLFLCLFLTAGGTESNAGAAVDGSLFLTAKDAEKTQSALAGIKLQCYGCPASPEAGLFLFLTKGRS